MAADKLPVDIITPKSLYTITGAAASVWLFGAVLFTVLGTRVDEVIYRAIGFGLSLLIAIGMMVEKKRFGMKYWLLIIPNAALIFINASGFNAVNNGSISTPGVAGDTLQMTVLRQGHMPDRYEARLIPFFKDVNWWPDPLLKQELAQLRIHEDSLVLKNQRLEAKIQQMEALSPSLNQGPGPIQPYLDKIALLELEVVQLKQQNQDLLAGQGADAALAETNSKLQNQLNDLRKQLQAREGQLAAANLKLKECQALAKPTGDLDGQVASLNKQVADLKSALAQCNSRLAGTAGNTSRLTALEEQLAACQNQLASAKGYAARIRELEAELARCQGLLKQSGTNTSRISELETQLKSCETMANRYKLQLAECQKNAASAASMADMKEQLAAAQRASALCNGQLKAVRDSLQNCIKRIQVRTVSPTNRAPQ